MAERMVPEWRSLRLREEGDVLDLDLHDSNLRFVLQTPGEDLVLIFAQAKGRCSGLRFTKAANPVLWCAGRLLPNIVVAVMVICPWNGQARYLDHEANRRLAKDLSDGGAIPNWAVEFHTAYGDPFLVMGGLDPETAIQGAVAAEWRTLAGSS